METHPDCIPCFFTQALRASKIAGADESTQKKVLDKVAEALPKFSMDSCPSEMGRTLYNIVRKVTGVEDPYKGVKADSNKAALGIYSKLRNKVKSSKDRLLAAVRMSVAGNIIDYGAVKVMDVNKELARIMADEDKPISKEHKAMFDYKHFRSGVEQAETVLYIGDNAGEIVFDKILLEEIVCFGKPKKITFAVKKKPIINDALLGDAQVCGIDKIARVVSSGADAPGTILSLCSKEFVNMFNNADLIISKGQGNFEALAGEERVKNKCIFFLLVAKCCVSARYIGCSVGDIILSHNFKSGNKYA